MLDNDKNDQISPVKQVIDTPLLKDEAEEVIQSSEAILQDFIKPTLELEIQQEDWVHRLQHDVYKRLRGHPKQYYLGNLTNSINGMDHYSEGRWQRNKQKERILAAALAYEIRNRDSMKEIRYYSKEILIRLAFRVLYQHDSLISEVVKKCLEEISLEEINQIINNSAKIRKSTLALAGSALLRLPKEKENAENMLEAIEPNLFGDFINNSGLRISSYLKFVDSNKVFLNASRFAQQMINFYINKLKDQELEKFATFSEEIHTVLTETAGLIKKLMNENRDNAKRNKEKGDYYSSSKIKKSISIHEYRQKTLNTLMGNQPLLMTAIQEIEEKIKCEEEEQLKAEEVESQRKVKEDFELLVAIDIPTLEIDLEEIAKYLIILINDSHISFSKLTDFLYYGAWRGKYWPIFKSKNTKHYSCEEIDDWLVSVDSWLRKNTRFLSEEQLDEVNRLRAIWFEKRDGLEDAMDDINIIDNKKQLIYDEIEKKLLYNESEFDLDYYKGFIINFTNKFFYLKWQNSLENQIPRMILEIATKNLAKAKETHDMQRKQELLEEDLLEQINTQGDYLLTIYKIGTGLDLPEVETRASREMGNTIGSVSVGQGYGMRRELKLELSQSLEFVAENDRLVLEMGNDLDSIKKRLAMINWVAPHEIAHLVDFETNITEKILKEDEIKEIIDNWGGDDCKFIQKVIPMITKETIIDAIGYRMLKNYGTVNPLDETQTQRIQAALNGYVTTMGVLRYILNKKSHYHCMIDQLSLIRMIAVGESLITDAEKNEIDEGVINATKQELTKLKDVFAEFNKEIQFISKQQSELFMNFLKECFQREDRWCSYYFDAEIIR